MKTLGIIPARGGSKGVPRKNIRLIAGKPLIAYTIEAAKGSRLLRRLITSTDDIETAEIAKSLGSEVLMRPTELAADDTPMFAVIQHVLETIGKSDAYYEHVVILQPTAPFRTSRHIDEAITLLENTKADSVVSVSPVPGHYNPYWQFIVQDGELRLFIGKPLSQIITRRQELPKTYTRNGAIYAFRTALVFAQRNIYGDRCIPYIMSVKDSVNIDSVEDFWLAERLLTQSIAH
jgi:CMP-N-acetylneuraminic acid synthetase